VVARLGKEGDLIRRGPLKHPTPLHSTRSFIVHHLDIDSTDTIYTLHLLLTPAVVYNCRRRPISSSTTGVPRLPLTLSVSPITWRLNYPRLQHSNLHAPAINVFYPPSHTFVFIASLPRQHGAPRSIFLAARLFVRPRLSSQSVFGECWQRRGKSRCKSAQLIPR
jgi:hypothetical protein